jgi:outer membrane receptor protein involved in Fe transport
MRKIFSLFFLVFSLCASSQTMNISGSIADTTSKAPLKYAVIMAIRLKDSMLIRYTRPDENGFFKLADIPIDTYRVVITHPQFGEMSFLIIGSTTNNAIDFGKLILPPKSHELSEVVVYASKDPIYYKGDTLMYVADSFKVKANATVEDLLKKLPGMTVDDQGKIKFQGTNVTQVLVDGDEFFGSDPTMATKNLDAKSIESVQVYDKKNDAPSDKAGDDVSKVINLKLKEDAKKGYFGKVAGASDNQQFHEGTLLANHFTDQQKISVFGLASNTPTSTLGFGDMFKYGLSDEMNMETTDDGDGTIFFNNSNAPAGIPVTWKAGFYYTDKLSKSTKLSFNYSYTNQKITSATQTTSDYFLPDSNYTTSSTINTVQTNQKHSFNLLLTQKIDSLTELEIQPKVKVNLNNTTNSNVTDFINSTNLLTRSTNTENDNSGQSLDINTNVKLKRNFKKKDRQLILTYNFAYNNSQSTQLLKSSNTNYSTDLLPVDSINQQKLGTSDDQKHSASIVYTEPITNKIRLEFAYDYSYSLGNQNKQAFDFLNGSYSLKDSAFTNNFRSIYNTNREGAKFIYEVKKDKFTVGLRVREMSVSNINLIANSQLNQAQTNLLPYLTNNYRLGDNGHLTFNYTTNSQLPTINQLQPVPDNSNPNQIQVGNPDLLPTFTNNFSLSFNTYRPLSGTFAYASLSFNTISNDFGSSTTYDDEGRTITQVVNVNGNYNGGGSIGMGILNPYVYGNYTNTTNYINNQLNLTKVSSITGNLSISIKVKEAAFDIGGMFSYSNPVSTLNLASTLPYKTQTYSASFNIPFAKHYFIESDANYYINSGRTQGYNVNYLLWNGSVGRNFLKNENLAFSIVATDILNQNISLNRNVQDNVITDTKTNVIGRYVLAKIVWKFNSNKTKESDEDDF